MKAPVLASFVAVVLLTGCEQKSEAPATSTNTASSGSRALDAPGDYLKAVANGQQSAVKVVDTTSVDKAIQLFSVENGRNPKDLNELVEQKYLSKIPDAPFGTKLVYDASSGTVKIVKQ
jgi:hypothetical protein